MTQRAPDSVSGFVSQPLPGATPPETPDPAFYAAVDVLLQNTPSSTSKRRSMFRKQIQAAPYDQLSDAKSIAEAALAPLAYAKHELHHANGLLGEVAADSEAEIARHRARADEANNSVADNLRVLSKLEALLG